MMTGVGSALALAVAVTMKTMRATGARTKIITTTASGLRTGVRSN